MKFQYGKIFRRINNDKVSVEIIDYDPKIDTDYYKFVKQQGDKGLIQIIVNSNIMLNLLKHYFMERVFDVSSIELMEEDEDFSNSYKQIIQKANLNRAYFSELVETLRFLFNEDCIEIFKISLKGKDNGQNIRINVQSNGIVSITEEKYLEESMKIKNYLETIYS